MESRKTVMKPYGRAGIEMQLERTDLCTQWGRGGVGRTARAARRVYMAVCKAGAVQHGELSPVPCDDPEGCHAGWMGGRGRSTRSSTFAGEAWRKHSGPSASFAHLPVTNTSAQHNVHLSAR